MQITETVLVKVPQAISSYSFGSLGNTMLSVSDCICCCVHNFQHTLKKKKQKKNILLPLKVK